MPNFEDLKNKQTQLIRKALDGSVFIADPDAPTIDTLTAQSGGAVAASVTGSAAAVNIATAGSLFLRIDGVPFSVALASADTPANSVTKTNTAIGAAGTASLSSSAFKVLSATTGIASKVEVIGGTGTVLANLKLSANQTGIGDASGISLAALDSAYEDLGFLTNDGAGFAREVSTSEVTSWGSVTPTRSDVTSDTSTLTVTCQETKLLTIGLATGADLSAATPDGSTGELMVEKPNRSAGRHYRALALAVDNGDGGEIYIARYFPRAKVSNYAEQAFGGGDDPITWGVTLTGEEDSDVGFSEAWIFGGPGWFDLISDMGF